MDWYNIIKRYFEAGYYSDDPTSEKYIGYLVQVGKITEAEFKQITGKDYTDPIKTT